MERRAQQECLASQLSRALPIKRKEKEDNLVKNLEPLEVNKLIFNLTKIQSNKPTQDSHSSDHHSIKLQLQQK